MQDKHSLLTQKHKTPFPNSNLGNLVFHYRGPHCLLAHIKLNLKDKVRRCFLSTHRFLDFTKIPLAVTNKIFYSLFIPIRPCGSEVWGIYKKDDFNTWEKDIIEKTYFPCKQSLGVNKLCPNITASNELGRLSLKLVNR